MLACKFSTDTRSLTHCSLFKFLSCSSSWLRWQTPRLPQLPALQGPDRCCCHGCRCRHRLPPAVHLWPSPPDSPSGSAGTAAAHSRRAAMCMHADGCQRVWGRASTHSPPAPPHPTAPRPAPRGTHLHVLVERRAIQQQRPRLELLLPQVGQVLRLNCYRSAGGAAGAGGGGIHTAIRADLCARSSYRCHGFLLVLLCGG